MADLYVDVKTSSSTSSSSLRKRLTEGESLSCFYHLSFIVLILNAIYYDLQIKIPRHSRRQKHRINVENKVKYLAFYAYHAYFIALIL
jgi:hypothetical protein